VYVGVPPLYKVEVSGKKAKYCYDEADLRKVLAEQPEGKNYNIQRFKGRPPLPTHQPTQGTIAGVGKLPIKEPPTKSRGQMVFPRLPSRVRRLRRGKGGGELPSLSTELSLRRLRDL